MPTKKPSKPQRKAKGKGEGFSGFNYKTNQPLPDTTMIPWSPPMPKTGRKPRVSSRR